MLETSASFRSLHSRAMLLLRLAMVTAFVLDVWRTASRALDIEAALQRHPTVMVLPQEATQLDWIILFFLFGFIARECMVPTSELPSPQLQMLYFLTAAGLGCNTVYVEAFSAEHTLLALAASAAQWLVVFAAYVLVIENVEPPHIFATLSVHKECGYPCRRPSDYLWMRVPFTLYSSWLGATAIANLTIALADMGVSLDMYIYISCFSALLMANVIALLWQGDLVFAAVGVWAFVWLEMKSAKEKVLVVDNSDEFAAVSAIQAMATLGLCVLVSIAVVLLVVRFYVRRTTNAVPKFKGPSISYYGSTT
ncbi:hypothetical protein ACHHYP_03356 [Achlya hypogyna]|uniref:Transmembrane protein n=1 Tax=Achlya hypogyna TaxID=1202772 RepID=A0A1V9Z3U1_ACHHY|nr:hypothetical protein ACHHYP_03356 [Achlya hypogyna]